MKKRFIRIVLLQFLAILSLCSCMENPETASVTSQVSELSEEKEYVVEEIEPAPNPFFFTMENEYKEVAVSCELNFINQFTGTGVLRIEKLQGMKLDHFYEVKLTKLEGECSFHNDTTHSECEFSSEFPIGIFYVDSENIYLIPYEQAYIEFLQEADTFPLSEEELANYYQQLREKGEHSDYINWRMVCTENGFEDTIGEIQDENDLGADGILRLENYHNYITVDGDERHYHLYPELTQGTQEHMYMTWKEGQGIVSFSNWAGNFKDYISFQAEMNWGGSIDEREIEQEQKEALETSSKTEEPLSETSGLDTWVGRYSFGETTGYPDEADIAPIFMDYEIQIYQKDANYYADIYIDGQLTMARGMAQVYGDESWISLVFLRYLPEHSTGGFIGNGNNVLISFRREGDEIYTYWGEISPLLYENEESGRVYFTKDE